MPKFPLFFSFNFLKTKSFKEENFSEKKGFVFWVSGWQS